MLVAIPLPAYHGDGPFSFVSYSHDDSDAVYAEIRWLQGEGVNVWYDTGGIRPGSEWSDELARAIKNARHFVYFITPRSVASENCRREVNFALAERKNVLAVHLESTDLPDGLRLNLENRQAILKHSLTSDAYQRALLDVVGGQTRTPETDDPDGSRSTPRDRPMKDRDAARLRWRLWTVVVVGIALVGLPIAYWYQQKQDEQRWFEHEALPAVDAHIQRDEYAKAYALLQEAERRVGTGSVSAETWNQVAVTVNVDSSPSAANVSYRLYEAADGQWTSLGRTPIDGIKLPRGWLVLRFEKEHYATETSVAVVDDAFLSESDHSVDLPAAELVLRELVPPDMITVPATDEGPTPFWFPNFKVAPVSSFLLDRTETTNAQFQEFVDARGYADPEYWEGIEFVAGQAISWADAVARFTDTTGRPGPAHWELGKYLPGTADHPVHGISWFEATAYANFRGKSLPTWHHWVTAAVAFDGPPIAPLLIQHGNFAGSPADVATTPGLSPSGAYDMAGNVAEWVSNGIGADRIALGGSAADAPYTFTKTVGVSPWDRQALIGIRCARLDSPDAALFADLEPVELPPPAQPMSDEAFKVLTMMFEHIPFEVAPRVESETRTANARVRKVSLNAGVADERFNVFVFLPLDEAPPYQAVLFMSGDHNFSARRPLQPKREWEAHKVFDLLVRSGRAVVWPVWYGSFENSGPSLMSLASLPADQRAPTTRDIFMRWRKEFYATVAYLDSTGEFEQGLGWLGLSLGAIVTHNLLSSTERLDAIVLLSGGNRLDNPATAKYVETLTTPTLLLNGRYDRIVSPALSQRVYDALGTPEADKRLVFYDTGHWPLPRNHIAREMTEWLDRYLGPPGDHRGASD